jgi:hypothetical protein
VEWRGFVEIDAKDFFYYSKAETLFPSSARASLMTSFVFTELISTALASAIELIAAHRLEECDARNQ